MTLPNLSPSRQTNLQFSGDLDYLSIPKLEPLRRNRELIGETLSGYRFQRYFAPGRTNPSITPN